MGYELIWCDKRKKYLRRELENRGIDKEVGVSEPVEISDKVLSGYIESDYYREKEFSKRELIKGLPISANLREMFVSNYLGFMEEYLNRIRLGRRPDKSYILTAPAGFGKKFFVYQVIKDAIRHKLTPTRLYHTQELYMQLEARNYNEVYKLFEDKDIGLLTMGGAPAITDLIVVKAVLDYCARKGVPLLVISRFTPDIYHKWDTFTSSYLGVRATDKGNYSVLEHKGLNARDIFKVKEEIEKRNRGRG